LKFLIDQNLSPRLLEELARRHPGSTHVRNFGMERADDLEIWEFAKTEGYTIISKDSDFRQLSFLFGHPPKVVWVHLGNCPTNRISSALGKGEEDMAELHGDDEASFLTLS